jgi:Carboxypeptidase regulatory-like domain
VEIAMLPHPHRLQFSLLFAFLVFLVFIPQSHAQQTTASISGTVKDPSGAVLPQAQVTATNTSTGSVDKTVADAAGVYTFPSLRVGTYTISAEQTGFTTATLSGITLQIYQKAVVDIVMHVGGTAQTVTVQGSTALVDPSTASLGTVVNEQAIQDLPLNLREVGALALTVPGTIDTSGRSLSSATGNGSGFNDNSYSGAGGYSGGNLLLIDGMVSRSLNNGSFALNPPPEMVKEFKIQNNIYDAAFGLTSGTAMNLITQSGTNSIHGGVWEYLRNRDFDARNYFDIPAVSADRPEYTRNQFGGDLGFPILKNKLFLFGAYEGLRLAQANNSSSLVPSVAEKQGDFSGLLTRTAQNLCGAGGPGNLNFDTGQLFDPATESKATCPNSGNVILVGTPIPNNNIAAYRGGLNNIDPVAQKVLALFPNPNNGQFYLTEEPKRDHRNQFDGRIDWNFSQKDLLFARYLLGTSDQIFPGPFLPFNGTQHFRGHNAVVGWTHTFGPSLINDFRAGYQTDYLKYSCQGCPRASGTLEGFDIAGLAASSPQFEEYPNVTFANFATWGDGFPGYYPDILPDSVYKFEDSVTKIFGKHNLTFGADLNFWQTDGVEDPEQVNGILNFNGQFSDLGGESSAATVAADASDLELGFPSGGFYTRNAFVNHLVGGNWLGVFVQDNFRVNSDLTLEAGIRWDYRKQPVDKNNQVAAFYPLSKTYQSGDALLISGFPNAANDALCSEAYLISASGECLVATSAQRRALGFNGNQVREVSFGPGHGNFSPRLAISARPTGSDKLVVHAGFGIFLDLPLTNQIGATDNNNPISTQSPTYNTSFGAPPPLTNGIPTTTQQMFVNANAPTLAQVTSELMPSPFYHTPTVYEWSMSVQTQLGANWALETAYMGNRGDHLDFLHLTGNQPMPGTTSLQVRRPWPDFNQVRFDTYDAYSNYNALTVKVTKRASNGLSGLVGYTYSKAMDDNSGTSETEQPPQDDNNPNAEYAVADTSIRNRLVLSGVYEFPVGRGRQFMNSVGPVMNALVGGWDLSSIIVVQSGYPFTVTSASDFSNTNSGSPRPDRTCSGQGSKSIDDWFNLNCFNTTALQAALANGTPRFGDSRRNILVGPGLVDLDASLIKRVVVADRLNTEFRAEVFNILNHPNFALPNASIGNAVAGIISNTVPIGATGYNREIQLGLRLVF